MSMDAHRTDSPLNKAYQQAVDALISAAAERDHFAKGHSERVSEYSVRIAEQMGLSSEELVNVKYAASLHDIGKVAVSTKILNKIGKLSSDEFAIMRQHSTIALRILGRIDGLQDALPMIRHHHERWDGGGYPDGLKGEDIPLGARIIAAAETYDILTSDVPWRPAFSHDVALAEIEFSGGTQLDPRVVEAVTKSLGRKTRRKAA